MKHNLTIGQDLWWVPSDMRGSGDTLKIENGRPAKVTAVGKKWVKLSNMQRVDIETMRGDGRGYMSSGEAFLSPEAAVDEVARRVAWDKLRIHIRNRYDTPKRPTLEQIQAFYELIKEDGDAD